MITIFQRLSFKLISIVTLASACISLIVFSILLGSLAMSFRDQNEQLLDSRLLSYWAEWQYGGNEAILERAEMDMEEEGGHPFLLLLKDVNGEVISGMVPNGWEQFDLMDPALDMLHPKTYLTLRYEGRSFSLLLTGAEMEDGSRVVIGISSENREMLIRLYQSYYPVALMGIVLAGMVVGIIASQRMLKPIRQLNQEIDRIIVTGELSRRLESSGTGDQFDGVIVRYNRLLDRVESLIGGMKETLDAVAHDLRTPLTRLRGYAEIALTKGDSQEYEEALAVVVEQTDQTDQLLSAIMDIVEAEQDMLILNTGSCNLRTLTKEIVEMYCFVAEEKDQTITLHAPDPVLMTGDPVRIRRILGNLVDNAVKYSPEGGQIDIHCYSEKDKSILEVIDDGPGIPEDERNRVFERLYRGDRSRSSRGLGLGLSMVKALLEAHNGNISILEKEGRGAVFHVEFPNISQS